MATRADDIAALYAEERSTLARSATRLVGHDHAEDLVHDAFVTYISRTPEADRPGAWLSRVTRNRALNELRRARVVSLDEDIPAEGRLGERAERNAVRAVLAEALTALPDRYRRALELRFLNENDYAQIAEELEVSIAQAHVVLHRATRRLGRELVRRLAEPHNAAACVPAIERMLGFAAEATEHQHGSCERCAPVLDELHALRAMPALVPATGFLHRLWAWVGSHAPSAAEPASALAGFALTLSLALAPTASAPALTPERSTPAAPKQALSVEREADTAGRNTAVRDAEPAGRAPNSVRRSTEQIAVKDEKVTPGPVNVSSANNGSTQTEVGEGTGTWSGVNVCEDPTATSCD